MNDQTTITIEPETKASSALATIETTNFALVFVPGGVDLILERIKRDARAEAAKLDISTPKNRKAILSLKNKVVRTRTTMDAAGKDLKAEWLAKSNAIDADRRKARAELEALEQEIEAPVVAYQKIEDDRRKANEDAVAAMEAMVVGLSDLTAAEIVERRGQLAIVAEFNYSPEFVARADGVQAGVFAQLEVAHGRAVQREEDAAQAEAERLAEIERARLAAIEAQRQREEQIAREAAEAARVAAEARAAREAEEARQATQREREAAEAAARAETDAAARREQDALAEVERAKRAAEQAEADLLAAIERERIATERAEINRLAEVARAEREKAEAVEAERRRMEQIRAKEEALRIRQVEEERAEAERRAANVANRRRVNGEAVTGIIMAMADAHSGSAEDAEKIAKAIVTALAKNEIRHCSISY